MYELKKKENTLAINFPYIDNTCTTVGYAYYLAYKKRKENRYYYC